MHRVNTRPDISNAPLLETCLIATTSELKKFLALAALYAPSHANMQPFRFAWENDTFKITLRNEYHTPLDAFGQATAVSLGAALENLWIAASYYGLGAELVELRAVDSSEPTGAVLAKINFVRG